MDESAERPLHSLSREHRLLARAADALERYARLLEQQPSTDVSDLSLFARFFTEFAELCHHVKEEDILLPELVRHGFAWDSGAIAQTRRDHEQERYLVSVFEQAASQDEAWSREDRRQVVSALVAFVEFERKHVRLEDTVLLPAAIGRLTQAQLSALDEKLDAFETERFGSESYARLTQLGEDLIARYAPDS